MTSPTSRSLDFLRKSGFIAAVVEKWIPKLDRRQDLFGFADVLAFHPVRREFLLVQCTSHGHVGDRLKKARSKPALGAWLRAGGLFEVWGWSDRGVKRVAVLVDDLADVVVEQPRRRQVRRPEPTLFE